MLDSSDAREGSKHPFCPSLEGAGGAKLPLLKCNNLLQTLIGQISYLNK